MKTLVLILLCFVAFSSQVQAQETDARALFDLASSAYDEGRFDDCVSYLRQAHDRDPRPALLLNLGRCASAAGHRQEATEAYVQYLLERPDAEDRGSVEAQVRALQVPPPVAPEPAPSPEPVSTLSEDWTSTLGVAGATVFSLGLALTLGGIAQDQYNTLLRCAPCGEGDVAALSTAANVFFGAAAVGVAVTLVLFILELT